MHSGIKHIAPICTAMMLIVNCVLFKRNYHEFKSRRRFANGDGFFLCVPHIGGRFYIRLTHSIPTTVAVPMRSTDLCTCLTWRTEYDSPDKLNWIRFSIMHLQTRNWAQHFAWVGHRLIWARCSSALWNMGAASLINYDMHQIALRTSSG